MQQDSSRSTTKDRKGCSLTTTKKYISANYKVDVEKLAPHIRRAITHGVEKDILSRVGNKGKGAFGLFKVAEKVVKPKTVEAAKKPKTLEKPKKVKTPKKAAKPKKVKALNVKTPKKAKTPKKSKTPKKPKAAKKAKMKSAKKPAKKIAAKKQALSYR